MRAGNILTGGVAASILFATAASAADISPIIVPPAPPVVVPEAPKTLSAYVEAFAGLKLLLNNIEVETPEGDGPLAYGFGAAAHLAWQPHSAFSIQGDAWIERWSDPMGDPDLTWGFAGHATVRAGNFQFGPLVSIGEGYFGGRYVNVGGEAAVSRDRVRVYTQAGYVIAIGGTPLDFGSRDIYTHTVMTYYARPNVAISVNAGADYYRELDYLPAGEYSSIGFNAGTRIEFQPEGRRFGFFAAYQFDRRNNFNRDQIYTTHVFGLGITAMLGQPDIQSRDRAIGLADYNAMFGPTFPH